LETAASSKETAMTKALQEWKVLPHGKLTQIDENILTVVGAIHMPLTDLPRRMTVVRLNDGRLVVFSAIALDGDEMRALEDYGRPAFLVVPNDHHRLDAKIWKDRYPTIEVVAPEGSREKVDQVVHVDTTDPRFDDPNVQFVTVPGTRGHEAARRARRTRHDAGVERYCRQYPRRDRVRRLVPAHDGIRRRRAAHPETGEAQDGRRQGGLAHPAVGVGGARVAPTHLGLARFAIGDNPRQALRELANSLS
jgi:hypothetical protein